MVPQRVAALAESLPVLDAPQREARRRRRQAQLLEVPSLLYSHLCKNNKFGCNLRLGPFRAASAKK